jgi:hypothetical protein
MNRESGRKGGGPSASASPVAVTFPDAGLNHSGQPRKNRRSTADFYLTILYPKNELHSRERTGIAPEESPPLEVNHE